MALRHRSKTKTWGGVGHVRIHMGLIKIMLPQSCPYAALSRTFRTLSRPSRIENRDTGKMIMLSCAYFVISIYRISGIGPVSIPVRKFDFCTLVLRQFIEKLLKSRDAAEWTCPFWARVGSGRFAFRGPFADLLRTFRGFLAEKMQFQKLVSMLGWLLQFVLIRVPLPIQEHGTIRNWNLFISIDKQKQMSTSLYTYICQSVVYIYINIYIYNIQPQARILWQFCN